MKRYVLLFLIVMLALLIRNFWIISQQRQSIKHYYGEIDSVRNVIYVYEAEHKQFQDRILEVTRGLNKAIESRDSAIFSHGKQVRWLQWHIARLDTLIEH